MPLTDDQRASLHGATLSLFAHLAELGPALGATPNPNKIDHVLGGAAVDETGKVRLYAEGIDPSETVSAHVALAREVPLQAARAVLDGVCARLFEAAPICAGMRVTFEVRRSGEHSWSLGHVGDISFPHPSKVTPQEAANELVVMVERLSWCRPGPQLYRTSTPSAASQEVRAAGPLDAALYWLATCRRHLPMDAQTLARSGATTYAVFPHEHLYTEARHRGLPAGR